MLTAILIICGVVLGLTAANMAWTLAKTLCR